MAEFIKFSSIKEEPGALTSPENMVQRLLAGHEAAVQTLRAAFSAAEKAGDAGTVDLLTRRLQAHEKDAWMLRSILHR
jgi:starvation-inducible DNA-binding protein